MQPDPTKMTRQELIAACRRINLNPRGGLSRASKADLITWVQMNRARTVSQDKVWKLCERVDRNEIGRIRHKAETSRVDIDDWANDAVAEIEAHPGDRILQEFASREDAEAAADRRNAGARPGFVYYVEYLNATIADLRESEHRAWLERGGE